MTRDHRTRGINDYLFTPKELYPMNVRIPLASFLVISLGLSASAANAHFIWVRLVPADGSKATAKAYFAETPAPDRDELLDKISHAKIHVRCMKSEPKPIALKKSGEGDAAELTAPTDLSGPASLEATCDYGVYDLHTGPVLLQYYAKAIQAPSAAEVGQLGPAQSLALDIIPSCASDKLTATVLWQGKPLTGASVQVIGPDKQQQKLKTNEQGTISVPAEQGGFFALLASHTEKDKAGERNGKKYNAVGHYATLTIDVPTTKPLAAQGPKNDKAAAKLLARARDARAVWEDFPGFTADIVVQVEQRQAKGKLKVGAEGQVEVELNGLPPEDLKWVKRHLGSVTQHRLPDGSLGDDAALVQEEGTHPLGQRIRLAEEVMGSEYRIKDDVVRQVNRLMGKQRLVINVLDVTRNAEGKYLPSVFNVATWDVASGDLGASQMVTHKWLRVGKFDLPQHVQEVDCRKGGNQVRLIELSGHKLSAGPGKVEQARR